MILEGAQFCPDCGGELQYYDKIKRIVRLQEHKSKYIFKRYKCKNCGKVHRSITEDIFPFKQYDAEIINGVVEGLITQDTLGFEDYPSETTVKEWKHDFKKTIDYHIFPLESV